MPRILVRLAPLALVPLAFACGSPNAAPPRVAAAGSPPGDAAEKTAPSVLAAAPIDPASMPPQPLVVLRAARLFDGRSDAEESGGVVVVVENGLITKVGKASVVAVPAGARTIDLGDATLLPGFIDAHTHLSHEASGNYYKDHYQSLLRFPAEQAHYAASYARETLLGGFTTVRDLGADDMIDVGLRNAIAKGLVAGPRMLVAVHALTARGGHGDGEPFPPHTIEQPTIYEGVCTGADECREAVRMQVKYGADVIKVHASGGVLSLTDAVDTPQLTKEELSAIVDEAHRLGRKVAAHCHGDTAGKYAIDAGVDSIEHGTFLSEATLATMKAKGTVLVPTCFVVDWLGQGDRAATYPPEVQAKIKIAASAHAAMLKNALRIGVTIGAGTDSGAGPHGKNAREMTLLVARGMTPAAALRAATSVDAKLLGIDAQTGTLEAGKLADVVAVPGDPLADITKVEHVSFVMRAGTIYLQPEAR